MQDSKDIQTGINTRDFHYDLPESSIARFPPGERGNSALLHYRQGGITHHRFPEITRLLPEGALLVYNNTRVIPARIIMAKETGARIEIFLLEPVSPSRVMSEVMNARKPVIWHCMVGNAKKWKTGIRLHARIELDHTPVTISTAWKDRENLYVEISWDNYRFTFAEIVEQLGKTPLPPYLNREAEEADKLRYQTVFSRVEGAVAAPTAGLHFTPRILEEIRSAGIQTDEVTLHVSAGTFQPLQADTPEDHPMHSEQIVLSRENIRNIINNRKIIAVGTTSMRTLESTYWYGVKLLNNPDAPFFIDKLYPYQDHKQLPEAEAAFSAVLKRMDQTGAEMLVGETEIFIFPGYTFKVCKGLVTNFHLPGSTLILLIAAFVGPDWQKIYREALAKNYKFLSYGDSSLLLPAAI